MFVTLIPTNTQNPICVVILPADKVVYPTCPTITFLAINLLQKVTSINVCLLITFYLCLFNFVAYVGHL